MMLLRHSVVYLETLVIHCNLVHVHVLNQWTLVGYWEESVGVNQHAHHCHFNPLVSMQV